MTQSLWRQRLILLFHNLWNIPTPFSRAFRTVVLILTEGLFLISFLPAQILAQETLKSEQKITLSEDDLLLCQVRLGGSVLTSDMVTYSNPSGFFLPLGEMSRQLELGITVDLAHRHADGFVARPPQKFMLDMTSEAVSVSGKAYRYDPSLVVAMQDDIYVESKLLGEWVAMRIDANRLDATVDIRPFEPLPLQERMARSQRGSNTWGYGSFNDPGFPLLDTPYRFLDGPSIDFSLSSSLSGEPEKNISLGNSNFHTRISGDLLWMNGQLDLSGQIASPGKSVIGIGNGNLVLERVNPSGGILTILDARRVAVGDIGPSSLPLIGSSVGAGIIISSYPLNQLSFFDLLTLRGFLADGWDVELFNNGNLLDYRHSNPLENYAFVDIPLRYGLNELQLVFNGPMGKRRVETHIYNVGSNMSKPGSWSYQMTATNASLPSMLASPISATPAPLITWKSTLGVNKWLTASNYFASALIDNERQSLAGAGFSGYLKMIQLDVQVARNLATSQWARQASGLSRFGPLSLSVQLQDYDKEWHTTTGPASYLRKWDVRIDGLHPFFFLRNSPFSMTFAQTEYDALRTSKSATMTNSNQTLGINHTHTITAERTQDSEAESDVISGTSYASMTHRNLSVRAEIDYQLHPERVINTFGTTCQLRLPHELQLFNHIAYSPLSKALTTSLGLNHTFSAFALGVTGNYTVGEAWNVGIQLSTNLSREPQQGQWNLNGSLNSNQAGVSAQAYLDSNRNRQWDSGEPPIKDVEFFVNQQSHKPLSDENGMAFLQGISPNNLTDIAISPSTLTELLWVPADKGVRVVPRPGYPVAVNFPVWVIGEVSGTIYRKKNSIEELASGINIEAVDKTGTVVTKARSEFDGVYILKALPSGEYTVRVSPEQAEKLGCTAPSRAVSIPLEGAFIDNVNLVLDDIVVDSFGDVIVEPKSLPVK